MAHSNRAATTGVTGNQNGRVNAARPPLSPQTVAISATLARVAGSADQLLRRTIAQRATVDHIWAASQNTNSASESSSTDRTMAGG